MCEILLLDDFVWQDLDRKPKFAVIHIRRQELYTHAMAIRSNEGDLVRVVPLHTEQRRHVLDRVFGFEIGRLACDHSVVARVGFIEAVAREELDVLKDGRGRRPRKAVFYSPLDELFLVLQELFLLFLSHGLPNQISLAGVVAGQVAGNANDLFLINNGAVRLAQNRL